ncbi:MAG: hypothetical protein HUU37_04015 [Bdellovibrionales bacterium]|nr:hypothetical protein [Bdellovibrionales bacterium]
MKPHWKNFFLIFSSIMAAVLVLEGGLRVAGWAIFHLQARHEDRGRDTGEFVAIAIGESTTQGVGGADPERNYPNILEKILREKCPGKMIRVENLGVAGMNSWTIADALPAYLERFQPDLVITMIGINDPVMPLGDRKRSLSMESIVPLRVHGVIRPTPLRVVRLYGWIRASLEALFSEDVHAISTSLKITPEEILERIKKGEDIDGQRFAIHFSQPLQNRSIELSVRMHEQVLAAQPRHSWALLEMGNLMRGRDTKRAIQLHRAALEHLRNFHERSWFLCMLAADYATLGDWDSFRRIEDELMATATSRTTMFLADMYLRRGRAEDTVRVIKDYLKIDPRDPVMLGTLGALSSRRGTPTQSGALKPEGLPIYEDLDFTRWNYIRILDRALGSGARVLIMQYPTRSASLLKKMLHGISSEGWYVLSHEENFKNALRKHSYEELFTDYLGGTFGHMTKLGNTVLASHVADYLLSHEGKLRGICGAKPSGVRGR